MAKVITIRSADQLREHANAWDELWWSSCVSAPAARAELIAQWLDTFLGKEDVRILAVELDGRLVAALPLLLGNKKGLFGVGTLPRSDWTGCGDLLLRPDVDAQLALVPLVAELQNLDCSLLWLDGVSVEAGYWQTFCRFLREAGLNTLCDVRYEVGIVGMHHDWEAYRKTWSRMHRRNMKRHARQLQQQGDLQLRVYSELADDDVAPLIERGFAVEDRSWKGRAGSSVLSSGVNLDYVKRQSMQLNAWKQLELVFLELDGKPIAFEWGWTAKGVYHATKVGYDESYAKWGPGQVLRYLMYEQFFADDIHTSIDFIGDLTPATGKWCTRTYPVGRIVVGKPTVSGRALMLGYRAVRQVRDRGRTAAIVDTGQGTGLHEPAPV
ncbi:MAG: GNAT family N-acetyltransferase [Pirellulales bacterium]